jgi:hypothetical protein
MINSYDQKRSEHPYECSDLMGTLCFYKQSVTIAMHRHGMKMGEVNLFIIECPKNMICKADILPGGII